MRTSRRRSSTSGALLVLCALAAAPRPARADDKDVDSYRSAVARGAERFQEADYAAARRAFQLAWAIHPEPLLLFNIASTHRRQGHRALALRYYRRYLEAAPAGDSRRALAITTIAELEEEMAAPPAPPPPHITRRPAPREVEVDRGRALRWSGVAAGAGAAVAFGLAWSSMREARAAERSLEELPSDQGWDAAQADTYRNGRAASHRALIEGVTGGALAATGVALFAVGHQRAREVSLVPASGGGSLVVRGRF